MIEKLTLDVLAMSIGGGPINGGIAMEETWKDVVGYEGLYKISNFGRIKSIPRGKKKIYRTKGYVPRISKEKILNPTKAYDGYMIIGLHNYGIHRLYPVHVLVAETFIRNKLYGECINHKDMDKSNNNLENLEIITYSKNSFYKKMSRKGLKNRYRGVYKRTDCKRKMKWSARIIKDYRIILIGDYKTQKEARAAYIEKAKELYGPQYCSIL